ncbi:exodeoxyribonuclease VII small subunit [Duncaniella dubosii]|jgi:exodeoxyribonuclease VII small subunit|uniref:Exodeoxyribonuclease VII small subunit n=3 Tax=Duncaniella TaxID=2518495 RepID=A0A4P7W1U4_9BACT|nr:exodeoxyribonuclease VII small subunit [Duncaniella dubosii]QCD41876.1 exodeoxyribonuclease VII small subunit [Duncaniella dubosii]ROS89114.1 exodeoxyribonuclease VII small subunit [Muribaculaceae bacterium Isolate-080 (Janvier)]HBN64682.1 exodeoxyribonuclease VII small subunit [Porphyromonadaceae bacterium]
MMDFKPISELTYAQSVSELESILRMMQSDTCDIDHLAAYTRRATELLKACRTRLTTTEEELRDILASLGNEVARNS